MLTTENDRSIKTSIAQSSKKNKTSISYNLHAYRQIFVLTQISNYLHLITHLSHIWINHLFWIFS